MRIWTKRDGRSFCRNGGVINARLIPGYAPVYAIAALSFCGAFALSFPAASDFIFAGLWTPQYILLSPFVHSGAAHFLLNILGLHYIGGQMLLPFLGARRFLLLFAVSALAGTVANNLLSGGAAAGISAAVLGMLACSLHRFARTPMRLLLVHDLLRLPPFPLWTFAAFVVFLDIAGLIFGWRFFAHWAHLAGFAAGGVCGFFWLSPRGRRRTVVRRTLH